MVTLAVAAILMSVAAPGLKSMITSNRTSSASNDLLSGIQYARSEAVKRDTSVTVCPSADGTSCSGDSDWASGWIVRTMGTTPVVLRVGNQLHDSISASGPTAVVFRPAGNADITPSGSSFSISADGTDTRNVCVEVSGGARVVKVDNC